MGGPADRVRSLVQDHPRREWCSAACGNRARAVRHRRHRDTGA
ncbi:CGNR zinc finger domain-containing protein [Modestobacter muralis]